MQTISINFIVPQGWHELSDKQLRYVYQLIADEFATDEIKTLLTPHWHVGNITSICPCHLFIPLFTTLSSEQTLVNQRVSFLCT